MSRNCCPGANVVAKSSGRAACNESEWRRVMTWRYEDHADLRGPCSYHSIARRCEATSRQSYVEKSCTRGSSPASVRADRMPSARHTHTRLARAARAYREDATCYAGAAAAATAAARTEAPFDAFTPCRFTSACRICRPLVSPSAPPPPGTQRVHPGSTRGGRLLARLAVLRPRSTNHPSDMLGEYSSRHVKSP